MARSPSQMADMLGGLGRLKELRQRLLFLIGALVVFRLGTFIPVPGVNPRALLQFMEQQQGTILDVFNMFSGGALGRFSLFALGVMPYISASIIIQLATAMSPKLEALKKEVQKMTDSEVYLNIQEVRKAEVNAQLVAENIAQQLERRIAFRRALKRAVQTAMKFGAKGIRVNAAGRLGNSEMGRREWYLEGRIPLHTLRADIDYGFAIAKTSGGTSGVKAWIFKGEVFDHREKGQQDARFPTPQQRGG